MHVMFVAVTTAEVPWPALSALGLGAIVGAVGTHLLSLWREKRQNDRERSGLLRLVRNELSANTEWAYKFLGEPWSVWQALFYDRRQLFREDAWKEVRVKLASLLSDDDFAALFSYYVAIAHLQERLRILPTEDNIPNLPQVIEELSNTKNEVTEGKISYSMPRALDRYSYLSGIKTLRSEAISQSGNARKVVDKHLGAPTERVSEKPS